ncbi:uncharacterized protein SPSK_06808 [Sporothrix schenckii 1099-18]|uniref:Uncharacterized protein n=1 Tax=Sporothrix schenckii 1099-18 TaxID=1397361 RepID=A0A0F2MKZ6_SPOSC|nr:uncharacterized protein SPSK_06808 [Sporothrix schenckii 1099-18]KJR89734.1 hypothetical protein SPSK_06808 [Sporothrix schenckii 1099-18]
MDKCASAITGQGPAGIGARRKARRETRDERVKEDEDGKSTVRKREDKTEKAKRPISTKSISKSAHGLFPVSHVCWTND